MTTYKNTWI